MCVMDAGHYIDLCFLDRKVLVVEEELEEGEHFGMLVIALEPQMDSERWVDCFARTWLVSSVDFTKLC